MRLPPKRTLTGLAALAGLLLLISTSAVGQSEDHIKVDSEYTILPDGRVELVDSWANMGQDTERFMYPSFTPELKTIPVRVTDGEFELSFTSRSFLNQDGPKYFFRSRAYYYKDAELDLDVTLNYPTEVMEFVNSTVEPASREEGRITWQLNGIEHQLFEVEFDRLGPLQSPWQKIPRDQIDPSLLPRLEGHEIPANPSQVLKDLQLLVKFARENNSADRSFLRELRKIQAQLYYVFLTRGMVSSPELKPDLQQSAPDSEEDTETEPPADGGGEPF